MRNIWLCPICGSTSKRQGNIRRHAKTKHEQDVVPTGYDPLSGRLSVNERFTTHTQQDLTPYFFPFSKQNSNSHETDPDPIDSLTHELDKMANFADALHRLKQHPIFSGLSTQTFSNAANFGFRNLATNNEIMLKEPSKWVTFYICPKCKKGISMPWNGVTARAAHEAGRCQDNIPVPSAADAQALETIKKDFVNKLIRFTEWAVPSVPRHVICLPVDEVKRYPFFGTMFNIVRLAPVTQNHWAIRACRKGKTEINGQELEEFITIASGNFAIFETELDGHEGYYSMQISA